MHNNKYIFERLLNTYYIITIVYHCMFKDIPWMVRKVANKDTLKL